MQHNKNYKLWFTLLELIVVITILAILGTIAFIAMQGYSKTARDSKRISDVSRIKTSLELFKIESATYPEVTDGYEVTYSWATARTQGTFWEQTYRNVEKLDKVPLDPTTDSPYTYSVTSNKKEYQVASIIETDLALPPPSYAIQPHPSPLLQERGLIQQAEAARTKARARITWTYNGKTLKVNKGIFTMIIAAPSIVASEYTPLETQLNNNTLAYDGFSNLPASYEGTTFETKGEWSSLNLVNKDSVELFSWKITELTDLENWATARKALVANLQTAYSNTRIATNDSIARLLSVDTTNNEDTENTANYIINNDSSSSLLSSTKTTTTVTSSDCNWTPHGDTKDFWSTSTVSFTEWQSSCDTAKKTFTCDNWSFIDWIDFADTTTYKYSSCVVGNASNCIAWSVIWTDATYSYSEISHWLTWNGDWSINVTNWTQNYSSVISCNNWEVTIDSETAWSLVCDSTYHEESWTCVSDTKTVSCTTTWTNPANSTKNTSEQVTINYVNWTWETAADCTWTCNENYTENAWACEANSQTVNCDSSSTPENATANIVEETILWNESPSTCSWTCNDTYHEESGACVSDTKQVTCTSWNNPANSTENTTELVTINYVNGSWETAANCSWTCDSGYTLDWNSCIALPAKSLRFNDDDQAYLSRTPATAGDRKTWTWSWWVKRGNLPTTQTNFFAAWTYATGDRAFIGFNDTDTLRFGFNQSWTWYVAETTSVYRDPSAWYHIIVSSDLSANNVDIYVNGKEVTYGSVSWPNIDQIINSNAPHQHWRLYSDGTSYFDGYLSNINFIDWQALTPSAFWEFDLLTGQWKAKDYTGTYGTNGFFLNFGNEANLWADISGNWNNWTTHNIDTTDQMLDMPENNFATWNSVAYRIDHTSSDQTYSEWNLKVLDTATNTNWKTWSQSYGSINIEWWKWYWEAKALWIYSALWIWDGDNHANICYFKIEMSGYFSK